MAVSLPAAGIGLDSLKESIDHIIAEELPEGTDIALMVYDLTNDTALYAHRENVMCRPASVQKVITSVTALSSLGIIEVFHQHSLLIIYHLKIKNLIQ